MRGARILVLSLIMLSACSARPGPEVLRPSELPEPPDARMVTVLSVTTRERQADQAWAYGTDRNNAVEYAAFGISVPPSHVAGQIEWPGRTPDPNKHFLTREQRRLDHDAFRRAVVGRNAGLYVHGYNTSFHEALYRTAQLSADTRIDGAPVLFSWPSEAMLAAYLADRDAADFSRSALADLLETLAAGRQPSEPVVVLAHSMGARLTMEALRQLKLTGRGRVLDRLQVVLAAPDIDIDVFREQMAVVGLMNHPITILVSSDDRALRISSRLSAGRLRVGLADVHNEQVQAAATHAGVRVVDISTLPAGDMAHSRYVDLLSNGSVADGGNLFTGLRRTGAFVFGGVGSAFGGISQVLSE